MYWRGVDVRVDTREMQGMLLYLFNSYSGREIDKLIEVCREAKIFADVGTNIGLISLSLAKACPNLEIFAFEPDHRILDKFRQNLDLNPGLSGRIHLIEKAVSDIDGELFFQPSLDPKNMGLGKIIRQQEGDSGSLRVSTVRFDNFFANIGRYPDVVKIDVEGEEGFVLEGMKNIPDSNLPQAIMLEVHVWYDSLNGSAYKARLCNFFKEKNYVPFLLEKKGQFREMPPDLLEGNGQPSEIPPEEWPEHCHIIALLKDRAGNG